MNNNQNLNQKNQQKQNIANQGQGSKQYMNEFAQQGYNAYSQSAKAATEAAKQQYKNQNLTEFAQGTGNLGQNAMSQEAKLNSQQIAKQYKQNQNLPNQGGNQ